MKTLLTLTILAVAFLGCGTDSTPTGEKKGEQGVQGIPGEQGEQGVQGARGAQGIQGEPGVQGIQGIQGDTGTGIQGEPGIQGTKGDRGDVGMVGANGDRGPKGDTGPRGVQGSKGDRGSPGVEGVQGEQGVRGFEGPRGPGSVVWRTRDGSPYHEAGSIITVTGSVTDKYGFVVDGNGNFFRFEIVTGNWAIPKLEVYSKGDICSAPGFGYIPAMPPRVVFKIPDYDQYMVFGDHTKDGLKTGWELISDARVNSKRLADGTCVEFEEEVGMGPFMLGGYYPSGSGRAPPVPLIPEASW